MSETRLLQAKKTAEGWQWTPKGTAWPCFSWRERPDRAYEQMLEILRGKPIPKEYRYIIDVGQDRGRSLMWLSKIANHIVSVDIDRTIIDLSIANYRMSTRRPVRVDRLELDPLNRVVVPEHVLIAPNERIYYETDLIKIDAGPRTLFVLESLEGVIANSLPTVFVYHDHTVDNDLVGSWLVNRGYNGDDVPSTLIGLTTGEFVGYVHPKRFQSDQELDDEKNKKA